MEIKAPVLKGIHTSMLLQHCLWWQKPGNKVNAYHLGNTWIILVQSHSDNMQLFKSEFRPLSVDFCSWRREKRQKSMFNVILNLWNEWKNIYRWVCLHMYLRKDLEWKYRRTYSRELIGLSGWREKGMDETSRKASMHEKPGAWHRMFPCMCRGWNVHSSFLHSHACFPLGSVLVFWGCCMAPWLLQMAYVLDCPEEGKMECGCGPM